MQNIRSKQKALFDFFRFQPKIALAFSGGTDSAYLLSAAKQCAADIQPYFIRSAFQPAFELQDAKRLCSLLGSSLKIIEADTLAADNIRENGSDRCYHCKRLLFSLLKKQAAEDGYTLVADGTNASDKAEHRPGMRALRELHIHSPLRECGITKNEIRRLSKKAHLFTWNKCAYACLATRIPCGIPIDKQTLQRIEKSENALAQLGFKDFRIRIMGSAARLEMPEYHMKAVLKKKERILELLREDFSEIVLNLRAR